ncbi:LuxR C-terminal-related transcriptional regulator [Streptomyces sp. NPDC088270]|uniref:response regulator transcription factor n=1 Tax=unclassified Streptomyces TaxID=2593676 RepID=UPI00342957A6
MTHSLRTEVRARLLAVADDRDLAVTVADVDALTAAVIQTLHADPTGPAPAKLTDQQTGVLVGLALGDSITDTARRMCVSSFTVKTHRRLTYKKLGARTGAQAVAIALSCGLLRPSPRSVSFPMPGQRSRRAGA